MKVPPVKSRLFLRITVVSVALLILADFVLPGKIIHAEIISVNRELQPYFNASRNHHYSYQIVTDVHRFTVEKDFANQAKGQENIEYSVSRTFQKVHQYRLEASDSNGLSSLRIFSAFVLPLLTLISMGIAYWFKKNMHILIFVLQALLFADLIYLLL